MLGCVHGPWFYNTSRTCLTGLLHFGYVVMRVIVACAQHKLWLYDIRAGQRPQLDLSWGDARITSLAAEPSGQRVWVANGAAHVEALDLRAKLMKVDVTHTHTHTHMRAHTHMH